MDRDRQVYCLIRPPGVESFRLSTLTITPPLGMAYIAAALEASGRKVVVVDAVAEAPTATTGYFNGYLVGLGIKEIVSRVPLDAAAVGVTCVFTHEWPFVAELTRAIRARFPKILIIVGGEHVTALPEFSLATSAADVIVMGEGEETVIELAQAMESGRPLGEIAGLAWRDGGQIIFNPRRQRRVALDNIPLPAWHHIKLEVYHAHRFVGGMYSEHMTMPILATRGCPYQCTFCSSPNMWTPRWIARDPVKVVDEIQSYIIRYGARNFTFQDLTAIVKREWIVDFCNEILRRGLDITWQMPTGTRSEAIDREVADLLLASGMSSMAYAPESGSETTRALIKKKMGTDRLFASIRAALDARLNVTVYGIIGFPHDTPQHMHENLAFVKAIAREGVSDYTTGYFMALPGTELFHELYARGGVRLDRAYFHHLIAVGGLFPRQTYCDAIGRISLIGWWFRLVLSFYIGRRNGRSRGVETIARMVKGLGDGSHTSRLQSGVRLAFARAVVMARTRLGRRWIEAKREKNFFAGWDTLYRRIWERKRTLCLLPAAREQQEPSSNIISVIQRDHATPRVFKMERIGAPT